MRLVLQRSPSSAHSTIGELSVDGRFECFTLEDVIRAPGVKVPGQTAIPAGQYDVQLTMSQRFSRVLPLLVNVPMFEGIRIHPGNTAKDTEGCILVGWGKQADWVSQSQDAFAALFSKLRAAEAMGQPITIEVRNP